MFDKHLAKKYKIKRNCHSCLFRHCCRWNFYKMFPNPDVWDYCRHWKLGKCYTCKFADDNDEEWFKRGCECWCFGGCNKYRKNKGATERFKELIRLNNQK